MAAMCQSKSSFTPIAVRCVALRCRTAPQQSNTLNKLRVLIHWARCAYCVAVRCGTASGWRTNLKSYLERTHDRPTSVRYACVIMAALRSRCGHYIFALWFLSIYLFYSSPNLSGLRLDDVPYFHTWCGSSANLECRSEMCCTRLAGNTGRKNDAKNRHLRTIAQLCRAIAYLRN